MVEIASGSARTFPRAFTLVMVALGILLAASLTLWAHYGTAVFYEMILAGLAACL